MFVFGKKKKFEPLVVENELGKFIMRYYKKEPCYEYWGQTIWHGVEDSILAIVNCDGKKSVRADKGFAKLSKIVASSADWDTRLGEYALDFAVSTYGVDGGIMDPNADSAEPVTYDKFAERIDVECVEVYENGSLSFDIDLDDMFADDCLVVLVDKDGNITDCELRGLQE